MATAMFDYDYLLYSAGSVGETRTIKVVHRASGDEYEFSTRTAFYGHWKKKAGGWLAEYNAAKKKEENKRHPDEFDIIDVQTPEPLANSLHTLKRQIEAVREVLGTKLYYGYSGSGTTFREDVSTILKYKGNREGAMRPVHLDDMKEYLVKNHACRIIKKIEADDACTIDSFDGWKTWKKTKSDDDKLILVAIDKDAKGTTCHLHNPNKPELGVDSHDGFGSLWLNAKGEVDGRGRMWLYYQVMDGDSADNYYANSANTDIKWASKSAYDILKDAKSDREAFQGLVKGYKTIYPAKRTIVGWRGYEDPKTMKILKPDADDFKIEVDWKYALQENFTLAKMLRWEGDNVNVLEVMDKLGVNLND